MNRVPCTPALVGVFGSQFRETEDKRGLKTMGEIKFYVSRYNTRQSPLLASEAEASAFILRAQPQSVDWATKYEGWAIEQGELSDAAVYGTENEALQMEIETARIDANLLRKRNADRFKRLVSQGISPEDAETYIENGGK